MKAPALYGIVAAAELALLACYFISTGVAVSPEGALASFMFSPPHSIFLPVRLLGVWAMIFAGAVVAALWLLLALGTGASLLARLRVNAETSLQNLLISLGLGLGCLSVAVFVLAAAHLLNQASVLAIGLGLLAYNARRWRSLVIRWPSRRWPNNRESEPIVLAGVLALALLVFHLIGALVPPSSFDEMDYQLSLPKLYLLNHGFVPTPFSHFSYFPKNINLLFLLGLLSGGAVVAKLLALALSVLATAALYAFTEPRLGRRAAALGAAAYFFTPVIGNQFRVAAPDMGTAFYELIGVFLLLLWLERRSDRLLILAAAFWGLALGAKYTAIPDFAATLLALAWLLRREPWLGTCRRLLFLTGAAGLFLAPWLVKNWLETGNPFTPIFSTVLTSRNFFFTGRYKATVDYTTGLGIPNYFPIHGLKDLLLLPWNMVVAHNDYNHDLGPLWLLLVPLAALSLRRAASAWLRAILLITACYWFFWLCPSIRITRYFTGGMALSALIAGWLLDGVPQRGRWRWALLLPAYLAWFQQSARMVLIQNIYKNPWGYLAGRSSLAEYLDVVQPDCPYDAIDYINTEAPPGARVLVFNEFRTFYLDRDFLASTPWDHDYWLEMIRESPTAQALLERLKERRVTYFLANANFRLHRTGMVRADDWTPADLDRERRLLPRVMRLVFRGGYGAWVATIKDRAS